MHQYLLEHSREPNFKSHSQVQIPEKYYQDFEQLGQVKKGYSTKLLLCYWLTAWQNIPLPEFSFRSIARKHRVRVPDTPFPVNAQHYGGASRGSFHIQTAHLCQRKSERAANKLGFPTRVKRTKPLSLLSFVLYVFRAPNCLVYLLSLFPPNNRYISSCGSNQKYSK